MNVYRIAVIPGDGIGPEVIREGIRALGAAKTHAAEERAAQAHAA
ncbi:MAG: hypothetical protein ACYCVB_13825 [Bacilli bacterium]